MNHLALLLVSLSCATFLAWYGFSTWESAEVWRPRPTEMATSGVVMISRQEAEVNTWLRSMEATFESRRGRVREVCLKYGDSLKRKERNLSKNLMIDFHHKLAYCRHGKVGTSTWLEYFLHLTDLSSEIKSYLSGKDKILHRIIPTLFSPHKSEQSQQSDNETSTLSLVERMKANKILTFSFVRHPFDRLVSAYVDKIKDQTDASYYSKIAKIQERYGGEPTFPHFVQYILDSPEVRGCTLEGCEAVDAHWRPFYARCAYCDIDYDVIGKMDSFEEDVRYVLIKQNLTGQFQENGSVFHLHHSSIDDLQKFNEFQFQRTVDYFSELSEETIRSLFQLYKVDFEMFDFSIEHFLGNSTRTKSDEQP